jgi:beta-glucanase (GH16 family)
MLTTREHFNFTYGRIEARIKIPSGQGMWAAFWLLGKELSWPDSGEIDVMENVGWEPKTIHGVVHGPGYLGSAGVGGTSTLLDKNFADDYHTFMVQWDNSRISFFADGKNYYTADRAVVERRGPWAFDHPFFIILNVAVGGVWSGNPDGSTVFPQRMSVDYVRVYRHTG